MNCYIFKAKYKKNKWEERKKLYHTHSNCFEHLLFMTFETNSDCMCTYSQLGPLFMALKWILLIILWTNVNELNQFFTILLFKIIAKDKTNWFALTVFHSLFYCSNQLYILAVILDCTSPRLINQLKKLTFVTAFIFESFSKLDYTICTINWQQTKE